MFLKQLNVAPKGLALKKKFFFCSCKDLFFPLSSGSTFDLRHFASTLKKISPKAFEFVRCSLAGADLQNDPELKAARERRLKASKKFKSKLKSARRLDDYDQVLVLPGFDLEPIL